MAGPITWRSVASTVSGGSNLFASGNQSIQQALGSLQRLAAEQQELAIRSDVETRARNTQDYLDQVAAFTSAEALADPAAQQRLEDMRLGYGNAIDRAATRAAVGQQLANLQRQETAAAQFQDVQTQREQRPLEEELYAAARSGDKARANQILADTSFLNEGQLAGNIDNIFRDQRQEARQVRQDARAEAQFRESMTAAAENRELRKEQIADVRENRQIRRVGTAIDGAVAETDARIKLLEAANPLGQKSKDVAKDASALMDSLVKADSANPWFQFNDNARTEVLESFQSLLTDGVKVGDETVPVTPAVLQQAITVVGGNFRGRSAKGEIEDYVTNLYTNNPALVQRSLDTQAGIAELRATQRNLNQQKRKLLSGDFDFDSLSGTLTPTTSSKSAKPKDSTPYLMIPDRDLDK